MDCKVGLGGDFDRDFWALNVGIITYYGKWPISWGAKIIPRRASTFKKICLIDYFYK